MLNNLIKKDEFCRIIKTRRSQLGYSLQKVATAVDISKNALKKIEDGAIEDPGFFKSLKILDTLAVDFKAIYQTAGLTKDEELDEINKMIATSTLFSEQGKREIQDYIRKKIISTSGKISKILVIDDQEVFIDGISALLKRAGFEVEATQDYQSTVDILREKSFDLALIDLNLSRKDKDHSGIDIIKHIKREYSNIFCIMITQESDNEEVKQQALDLGAYDYLDKTEDSAKLPHIIKNIERFQISNV